MNSNLCEWKNELWMERKANKTLFVRFLNSRKYLQLFRYKSFLQLKMQQIGFTAQMCEIYAKRKYTRKWNYFEKSWYLIYRESAQQHEINLKQNKIFFIHFTDVNQNESLFITQLRTFLFENIFPVPLAWNLHCCAGYTSVLSHSRILWRIYNV